MLDAGHQLGNHNFPQEINRPVPAGGFTKPCNTTGTATNGGYPEATFAWNVTMRLKAKLEKAGATVVLTRKSNREDRWGPCVDYRRARATGGTRTSRSASTATARCRRAHTASTSSTHPTARRGPTTSSGRRSGWPRSPRTALVEKGFSVANYIAGGDGLDERSDLGTLNLSDVPVVMLESGNMRDSGDAAVMTSAQGQERYARALALAIRNYLHG